MKRAAIIGVDPGQKGGIAIIPIKGPKAHTEAHIMPLDAEKQIDWAAFTKILAPWSGLVYVEQVHSMPKQGVASTFKFGRNYGGIFGVCGALGLPTITVTPQKWKKTILSDYETRDKVAAIDFCKKKFKTVNLIPPGCRTESDGLADALCLALYGLRATTTD